MFFSSNIGFYFISYKLLSFIFSILSIVLALDKCRKGSVHPIDSKEFIKNDSLFLVKL